MIDGEVKTACMQACPTNAIAFGNVNDSKSQVSKIRNEEQKDRTFYVLEQLHVLPNITYLAKVRNSDELDPHWGEQQEEVAGTKKEEGQH